MSPDKRKSIQQKFAPVDDAKEQAKRVAAWSQYFMGDERNRSHYWIRTRVEDYHLRIYEAMWSHYQLTWITGPRGYAKTTLAALVDPTYRICYSVDPYIIVIGKREKAGISNMRNVKRELGKNPKILEVYGNLMPKRNENLLNSSFELQTRNGIFVRSIGIMGDVRGSLEAMYRPTLIVVEDPQAVKHLREPATLEAHQDYIDRDVAEAIDEEYGKVRVIGNLLGQGCILLNLQSDRRWVGVDFGALINDKGEKDIKGRSIWESKFPTTKVHRERDALQEVGKLDIFMYEKMNIPLDIYVNSLKGVKYHHCSLIRRNDQNLLISDEYVEPIPVYTHLAIDPAFSKAEDADARALVTFAKGQIPVGDYAGKVRYMNCIWVLDYDYNKMDPDLIIDRALDLHRKYYYKSVIVETVGGQLIYDSMMNKAMQTDEFWFKNPFSFVPVPHHDKSKLDRIYSRFQPKIKLGQFFVRPEHFELQDECNYFIQNKNGVHILDALEMGDQYSTVCTEDVIISKPHPRFMVKEEPMQIPSLRNVMEAVCQ